MHCTNIILNTHYTHIYTFKKVFYMHVLYITLYVYYAMYIMYIIHTLLPA